MANIIDYIKSLDIPHLEFTETEAKETIDNNILAKVGNAQTEVFFLIFIEADNKFKFRYTNLKSIVFPNDFDHTKLFIKRLDYSYRRIISSLTSFEDKKVKKIVLTNVEGEFRITNKIFYIGTNIYQKLYSTADRINKRSSSYKTSIQNYLISQEVDNFNGKLKKNTTTFTKGELGFQIKRLNLPTKTKKEDFEKYLDDNDKTNLEEICDKLVRYEVFSADFLRRLDDYFVKEKLKEIIALGREIMALGKADIKSVKAKKVISKIDPGIEIKQLENIWQVYFSKYLLYLIFSYRKIYPKVEFEVEAEKKYTDFLGLNHYWGVDVIEIKHHLLPALTYDKSHKNYAFSGWLSKTIIQTINYMDAVMQEKYKTETDLQTELKKSILSKNTHRARGIIIISSADKLVSEKRNITAADKKKIERDFTKLRNSLYNLEILTFDEILDTAEYYITNIADK